jgi:hypothetical protein
MEDILIDTAYNRTAPEDPARTEIIFPEGQRALVFRSQPGESSAALLSRLDLAPTKVVIVVLGDLADAADTVEQRVLQLLSRGVMRVAGALTGLVVDGGADPRLAALVGRAAAQNRSGVSVLGVSPAARVAFPGPPNGLDAHGRVPLEPHHSHIVLTPGTSWGAEIPTLVDLVMELARSMPVVVVLAGGGAEARAALAQCAQQGWPVIAIEGSGGLADELARAGPERSGAIDDPVLAEIAADVQLRVLPSAGSVAALRRLLTRLLGDDATLRWAEERRALYASNSRLQRAAFSRLQRAILYLGVFGTFLSLAYASLTLNRPPGAVPEWLRLVLHYVIVGVPIVTSVLLAGSLKLNAGDRWVLLRWSAEAIKSEIVRYRVRSGPYRERRPGQLPPEGLLAKKVKFISDQLMQTDVNVIGLEAPSPERSGNRSGPLSVEQYVVERLLEQRRYYREGAQRRARELQRYQWLILVVGAVGTGLAVVGLEVWIALATVLAVACATYLDYQQVERTVLLFNQAETELANVEGWWNALPPEEQAQARNIDRLVNETESVLAAENASWVQQMKNALAELRTKQESTLRDLRRRPGGGSDAGATSNSKRPARTRRPKLRRRPTPQPEA